MQSLNIPFTPDYGQVGIAAGNLLTTNLRNSGEGLAFTFKVPDNRDIKAVYWNMSSIASGVSLTTNIELVNTTGYGGPNGILYDNNATCTITSSGAAGWYRFEFPTLPTSGLDPSGSYAVLLRQNNTGTCNVNSRLVATDALNPSLLFTGTNIDVDRSNFTLINTQACIAYFILEDDTPTNFSTFSITVASLSTGVFGIDNALAQTIVLTQPIVVDGIRSYSNNMMRRIGTPAGNLRLRLLDNNNNNIWGTVFTTGELRNLSSRGLYVSFPPIGLNTGIYRICLDSTGSSSSSNSFGLICSIVNDQGLLPSGWYISESTNMSTSFTWRQVTGIINNALGFNLYALSGSSSSITMGNNFIDPLTSSIVGI